MNAFLLRTATASSSTISFLAAVILLFISGTLLSHGYTVIIDPGHGGKDAGATPGHALEKTLTLDTCRRFAGELQRLGIPYVFTRMSDRFISLAARRDLSNRYPGSVFVSIHFNSSPNTRATGVETFYRSSGSRALAATVQHSVIRHTGAVNRGVKSRGFTVITNNPARAAILVEGGFLSNATERRRCMDPTYRQRLARAIAEGVVQTMGTGIAQQARNYAQVRTPPVARARQTPPAPRQQARYPQTRYPAYQAPRYIEPRYAPPRPIDPGFGNMMVLLPERTNQYQGARSSSARHHSSACRNRGHRRR